MSRVIIEDVEIIHKKRKVVDTALIKKSLIDAGLTVTRVSNAFDLDQRKLGRIIRNENKSHPVDYMIRLLELTQNPIAFAQKIEDIERAKKVDKQLNNYVENKC